MVLVHSPDAIAAAFGSGQTHGFDYSILICCPKIECKRNYKTNYLNK